MDVNMYEAQADSINVDDIATNSNNRRVLRRLQRNEASESKSLYIQQNHDRNISGYFPEGADDMGWLGYFIGKNEHLEELYISSFTQRLKQVLGMLWSHFSEGLAITNQFGK